MRRDDSPSDTARPVGRAELILLNAAVHTMEPGAPAARAVAVAKGRFTAVGGDADVLRLRGERTVVEDLRGAAVLPGIIDSHVHLDAVGRALGDADLYGVRSISEALDRLSAHARRVEPGAAVVGRADCLHPAALAERRLPTREDLDRVAADRTVAVTDVEKTILNTHALELLGLPEGAADPPAGGIGRDAAGRMNGAFFRGAKALTPLGEQNATGADVPLEEALARGARALAASGITGAVVPCSDVRTVEALRAMLARCELPLRVTALPPVDVLDDPAALERSGLSCGAGDDMARTGPLKVFYDRFVMHRSALMHEPYEGEPANRGTSWRTRQGLEDVLRRADAAGFALAVHVTGDRGLDQVMDALAGATSAGPSRGSRIPHHVIHAYLPTPRALDAMAARGVAAAVQPGFLRAWGDALRESLGDRRAGGFLPLRTYLARGIVCGAGSDGPIASFRPGPGLHAAVTRHAASGRALGEGEALTIREALGMYTLGSAGVTGDPERTGSIREGKLADMIVLARDPFAAGPEGLLEFHVSRTMVGGRTVYREGATGD